MWVAVTIPISKSTSKGSSSFAKFSELAMSNLVSSSVTYFKFIFLLRLLSVCVTPQFLNPRVILGSPLFHMGLEQAACVNVVCARDQPGQSHFKKSLVFAVSRKHP